MTKNEAIRLLAREALLMFEHDGSSTLDGDTTLHIINKIFDEHGEHLMDRDDEIELLKHRVEELIKPKTCEGCKYGIFESKIKYVTIMDEEIECCFVCVRNCNDYYEPKVTP